MPFGLMDIPVVFQWFVNTVFADLLDVSVIVYLDDILIMSVKSSDVFINMGYTYVKPEKCEFNTESTEYFRYQLSPTSLTMSLDKVQTILDWPKLWKVKDVHSFLGFANFYHGFIYNYSDIVTSLTHLTCKGVLWTFINSCHTTFQQLKEAFTFAPILVHWVSNAPLIVETNTSDYAIAGILLIHCTDEEIVPVAYYSWTLLALELNYDTHDKEHLTIHELFRLWCHYLEGLAELVDVVTDHKNLKYFSTTKLLTW